MSRILIIGYELPSMAEGAIEARSYRTWQFVEPLLADAHQICLVVSSQTNQFDLTHRLGSDLSYHRVNLKMRGWLNHIKKLHDQFKPDAILAVTFSSCLRATRLATNRPVWMDIYGDKLAEIQVAECARNSTRGRRTMLWFLKVVLREGDVYSTCSTPQKHALVGQLGMISRLNRRTMGYEFVHPVLPGAPSNLDDPGGKPPLRGSLVPEDSFIVLWSGGYNVWTDVETLFEALNQAMSRDPRVLFVSAGGGVKLARHGAYERFLSMIETSPHRRRFHMLGWRPVKEIPGLYRDADVGISLDSFHYETILGTRTRLVEMLRYGLPVITSAGCELSTIIRDEALGLTFPIGDAETLCDRILHFAADPTARQDTAERARLYASQQLSFGETTRPFREWAKNPCHAPDHARHGDRRDRREIGYFLRYILRRILWRIWALERGD